MKPCPFCGGEAEVVVSKSYHDGCYVEYSAFVQCKDILGCGGRGRRFSEFMRLEHVEELAIAAWNRRAKPKPAHMDAPFQIGAIIKPIVTDPYQRRYEITRETSGYMELKCVEGNLKGITLMRSKQVLARDWKVVDDE